VYSRLGDNEERRAEIRFICATNKNLQAEVDSGRFRRDLFYRINVINLNLPGLRERREDIALLADHFRHQLNDRFGRNAPPLSEEIVEGLRQHEWRGNIRELENFIARYTILGLEDGLGPEATPRLTTARTVNRGADGSIPLKRITKQAVLEMEANIILKALRENKWNRRKAAQSLKISYRALIYKIQEAGFMPKSNRNGSKPRIPQIPEAGIE
jgi:DNA-binding NtrC family response regulator